MRLCASQRSFFVAHTSSVGPPFASTAGRPGRLIPSTMRYSTDEQATVDSKTKKLEQAKLADHRAKEQFLELLFKHNPAPEEVREKVRAQLFKNDVSAVSPELQHLFAAASASMPSAEQKSSSESDASEASKKGDTIAHEESSPGHEGDGDGEDNGKDDVEKEKQKVDASGWSYETIDEKYSRLGYLSFGPLSVLVPPLIKLAVPYFDIREFLEGSRYAVTSIFEILSGTQTGGVDWEALKPLCTPLVYKTFRDVFATYKSMSLHWTMEVSPDIQAKVMNISTIFLMPKNADRNASLAEHASIGLSIDVVYKYTETLHCYAPSPIPSEKAEEQRSLMPGFPKSLEKLIVWRWQAILPVNPA
eukprot:CAMPEP_0174241758 /NCGR_PEP_ID=MMETSP0417-20130205/24731_1 /TAXON_ID=242541 /ORGANISM="Mayorella sp, Strain BSH-02190019" /LENGTH=360 /DNA_ID=CAMNT_0015321047 /DNA_START=156 /DNA_END=1234 /DNA_ORIENTATION=+